ncbi:MAG TPA: hypothetical protein PKA42_00665, partial [Candidatus Paceibacterota bacterium]|nr:hypothetical protein [Candidatus Paceibacterota bacterium]
PQKIKGLFLLAAPCGTQVDPQGNDCGSFQFEVSVLRQLDQKVDKVSIWHSTDDFVVPYGQALEYKSHLNNATLSAFTDKNHFLLSTFPELLAAIKELD